jgi:phosphomannomutase/phosphoglucomutase
MKPEIFREYDIRGIAETDLTDDVVEQIGKAFGTFLGNDGRVALGRDVRLSSPRIRTAFQHGLCSTGCSVVDVGVVPTPALYFAVQELGCAGGVMVTGSHNPIEYNGLKMVSSEGAIYGEDIQRLRELCGQGDFGSGDGRSEEHDIVPSYIDSVTTRVKLDRPLTVVTDSGNGTGGELSRTIYERLGCNVIGLYENPDGSFPNHLPDPTVEAFMEHLKGKVVSEQADLGIGFDGDADRIGAVDETGRLIWGDKLLALYAQHVLSASPGATIIFDVKCSDAVPEVIAAHGGVPLMWKTGHSLIKAKMKEEGALLAGEMSGHMFFADNYYGFDDALFAGARLLEFVSKSKGCLSEAVNELPTYFSSPEIRVDCPESEKFAAVQKLRKRLEGTYTTITIDGVRVKLDGGWALVRASNTQPILVLRFEGRSQEKLEEIEKFIRSELEAVIKL